MIKIVYIVSNLRRSGPTNQLYNLIKYLDRSRCEAHLVTLSPEPSHGSAWIDFESIDASLYTLGLSRIKGLFLAKNRLRSLVQKINPDVIHTQGIRADLLNASVLKDYPSVCTSRNYPLADYPTKFGKVRGRFMAWRHLAAFRRLNVVACSHAIHSQLRPHGINAGVVQNGVDTEKFKPVDERGKVLLRQKLDLPEDALIIVSVGSLIPRKDIRTLLAAFDRAGLVDAEVVVLGDGTQMEMLRQQAGPSVRMVGNVSNISDYLGAADVFVSTALSEGLPNTVLEAIACGLPCILSDIPPHRELFEHAENMFFGCGNVTALAARFKQVDGAQLVEQRKKSRQIAEERFSAQRMSRGYQQAYLACIGVQHG